MARYLIRTVMRNTGWECPAWYEDFQVNLPGAPTASEVNRLFYDAYIFFRYFGNKRLRCEAQWMIPLDTIPSKPDTLCQWKSDWGLTDGWWEIGGEVGWRYHARVRWQIGNTFITKSMPVGNREGYWTITRQGVGIKHWAWWQAATNNMLNETVLLRSRLIASRYWQPQEIGAIEPFTFDSGPHFDHVFLAEKLRFNLSRQKTEPLDVMFATIAFIRQMKAEYDGIAFWANLPNLTYYPTGIKENFIRALGMYQACEALWKNGLLKEDDEGAPNGLRFQERRGNILELNRQFIVTMKQHAEQIQDGFLPTLVPDIVQGGTPYFNEGKAKSIRDEAEKLWRSAIYLLAIDFVNYLYPKNSGIVHQLLPGTQDSWP